MQITQFLAFLAPAALVAPAPAADAFPEADALAMADAFPGADAAAGTLSMAAAAPQWTIKSFTRSCNRFDTACTYRFGINQNNGSPTTPCSFAVTGSGPPKNPASHAASNGVRCGAFVIGSNWSGQFGPGNGFTTFSVVQGKQIVYPAYRDVELKSGVPVSPDRSYPVYNLP